MKHSAHGFTLIELAIVLVIIGLIVGGVLGGQDLVKGAAVRAQISQIEKYNTAVNTFRSKYAYLPGDIPDPYASNFGFVARGQYAGEGDGNGVLEGVSSNAPSSSGVFLTTGEDAVFWNDLGTAHLLDANLTAASSTVFPGSDIAQTGVGNYLPAARIGHGNYVYVWSGTLSQSRAASTIAMNCFGLAGMSGIIAWGPPQSYPALTVQEAYNIDKKADDGLPMTGKILTAYAVYSGSTVIQYPAGGGSFGGNPAFATPPSSASCYDNNSTFGATEQYSMTQNGGAGQNCALTFRFQ